MKELIIKTAKKYWKEVARRLFVFGICFLVFFAIGAFFTASFMKWMTAGDIFMDFVSSWLKASLDFTALSFIPVLSNYLLPVVDFIWSKLLLIKKVFKPIPKE